MSSHDDDKPMTTAELNAFLAESVRLAEAEREGIDFAWTKRGAKVRNAVREYSDFDDDNLVVEGQVSG